MCLEIRNKFPSGWFNWRSIFLCCRVFWLPWLLSVFFCYQSPDALWWRINSVLDLISTSFRWAVSFLTMKSGTRSYLLLHICAICPAVLNPLFSFSLPTKLRNLHLPLRPKNLPSSFWTMKSLFYPELLAAIATSVWFEYFQTYFHRSQKLYTTVFLQVPAPRGLFFSVYHTASSGLELKLWRAPFGYRL